MNTILRDYYFNTTSDVAYIETFVFSHPDFTQTWRIVRNMVEGVVINSEQYEYYPVSISYGALRDDLDFSISINFGDLGTVIPDEIYALRLAGFNQFDPELDVGMAVKPKVTYNAYRSDTMAPLLGTTGLQLEVTAIQSSAEGSVITASAASANINKAGTRYNFDQFPMLRGFTL